MIILNVDQGSQAWFDAKLGVISASNAHKVLSKKGTETRNGYLMELVAQVATGSMGEEVTAKALEWGKENEASARLLYQLESSNLVEDGGFYYSDDRRSGCSPDGIIKGQSKGLELKSPYNSKVFVEFAATGKIKKEYIVQCQFSMWVTGFKEWDFASYDSRMKGKMLHYVTLKRDEEMMKQFDDAIPEFVSEMDDVLKKLNLKFGSQWGQLTGVA